MATKKKILIISHDKVGPAMAGPGIRYHNMAITLSALYGVTLATFNPSYLENLKDVPYDYTDIKVFDFSEAFDNHDIIIALWLSDDMIDYAKSRGKILVFDLYAPVPVENLVGKAFSNNKVTSQDDFDYLSSVGHYRKFLSTGDFFMCSNQTQKDFWVGYAFASGGIVPSIYNDFPVFDRIGICPMGINMSELAKTLKSNPIITHFPSIKPTDFVIVWTGGIWDWFDAQTPIHAISKLREMGVKDVKLVFLGTKHPNSDIPVMGETENAFALADKYKLANKQVYFLDGWIKYSERLDYLLSSDVAIYSHKPSIESRYSHRTRVLDHILTKLPTIATSGDYFADFIDDNDLGVTVEPQNADAIVSAILKLRDDKVIGNIRKNLGEVQYKFTWEATLAPLLEFLAENPKPRPTIAQIENVSNANQGSVSKIISLGNSKIGRRVKRRLPQALKNRVKPLVMRTKKR
jgi:glycosyltransferase involved in cell wall biosynthesis